MTFSQAITTCFKKYTTFSGVATRPEYWWFFLLYFIGYTVFFLTQIYALVLLWELAFILPLLAVNARRLHDTGRSGWYYFTWILFPWAIYLLCQPASLSNIIYRDARYESITEESATNSSLKCPTCAKMRLPGQNYCMGCGARFDSA